MSKPVKYIEIFFHCLFWIFPFVLVSSGTGDLYVGVFNTADNSLQVSLWYSTFLHAMIFYGCIYVILKRYRKGTLKTILFCSGIYLLCSGVETGVDKFVIDNYFFNPQHSVKIHFFLLVNLIGNSVFIVLASAYGFIKIRLRVEKNEKILAIEKIDAELKFLKTQINPHFLFNTLNNLYSLARKENATMAADGIAKLSLLMRYIIYDGNAELIPLEKEVELIKTYIELQKLRFSKSDNIHVIFNAEGNIEGKFIAPLLSIVLVENAFKHGISIEKESVIDIRLTVKEDGILFCVRNIIHKNNQGAVNQPSGFGLGNLKQRLDLLSEGRYDLTFSEENDIFIATLLFRQ